ncbi:MAG: nucleoside deaminase [Desulfonatronovibrio sp. MSAO_Bac4]|nr:MAG: nucleoside deaminase [Desulfonatronovibrio sp. MSAO_Bac4]
METALEEAQNAARIQEVPVGAVLVDEKTSNIIARSYNQSISLNDPTAHAEIRCLRQAGLLRANYRLPGTVMIVTLEPCIMCLGALIQARVAGVVFGARDNRSGAIVSRIDMGEMQWLNHKIWYIDGVLEDKCSAMLKKFFHKKRT